MKTSLRIALSAAALVVLAGCGAKGPLFLPKQNAPAEASPAEAAPADQVPAEPASTEPVPAEPATPEPTPAQPATPHAER